MSKATNATATKTRKPKGLVVNHKTRSPKLSALEQQIVQNGVDTAGLTRAQAIKIVREHEKAGQTPEQMAAILEIGAALGTAGVKALDNGPSADGPSGEDVDEMLANLCGPEDDADDQQG